MPCKEGTYNPNSGGKSPSACLETPAGFQSAESSCFYCSGTDFCSAHTGTDLGHQECQCVVGFYLEPGGGLCTPCPAGTTCDGAGTSLATIPVKRNFWRPSSTSSDAQPCPHADTCAGGAAAPPRYDAASTATCAPGSGLSGVFCTLCAHASATNGKRLYFDEGRVRCEPCDEQPLQLFFGLLFGVGGAAVACVVAWRWARARRGEWWQRVVGAARRAWRRVIDGRAGIKIVFSFCAVPLGSNQHAPRPKHGLTRRFESRNRSDHRAGW